MVLSRLSFVRDSPGSRTGPLHRCEGGERGEGEVKTKPKWFRININVSSFLSNCLSLNNEAQPRDIITFTFHKMSWDASFARVKHEVIIFWRDIKIMDVISLACILPSSGHMLSHHKSASQLMTKELKSQRPQNQFPTLDFPVHLNRVVISAPLLATW